MIQVRKGRLSSHGIEFASTLAVFPGGQIPGLARPSPGSHNRTQCCTSPVSLLSDDRSPEPVGAGPSHPRCGEFHVALPIALMSAAPCALMVPAGAAGPEMHFAESAPSKDKRRTGPAPETEVPPPVGG